MTRRNIDNSVTSNNPSPNGDSDANIMSPTQSSPPDHHHQQPHQRSPLRERDGNSPTMLATMTPVNVMELKKEMEEESALAARNNPLYAPVKTEVIYDKDDELYTQDKNTPIDLIYEDGNKTVIYTTTPDQKSLEIYSADNTGEITINNISAHQIHGQHQLADVLIDGNGGAMVSSASDTNTSGTVSVVLQGNGQGLLQYPPNQQSATTVLVLSELVEDIGGVPATIVGLR